MFTKAFSPVVLIVGALALPVDGASAQTCNLPNCYMGEFYRFDVVGVTNQNVSPGTLGALGDGPSVNEKGEVAFSATIESGGAAIGSGIFLWSPTNSVNPTYVTPGFANTNRRFYPYLQLNDEEQIAALDQVNGSPPADLLRIWQGNSPGDFTLAAESGYEGDPFSLVYGSAGLNGNGDIVFGASNLSDNSLLATPNPANNPPYNELVMASPVSPMIADTSQLVVREGNTNQSPIVLLNNDLSSTTATVIASTAQFSSLGQSPGITRDGFAVAFAGNMTAATAKRWKTNSGPGIFVALLQGGSVYQIVRIAGFSTTAGGVGTRQISSYMSTGLREEGLPWCDSGTKCVPGGELEDLPPAGSPVPAYFETFTSSGFAASTEWESRIAVTHVSELDGDTVVVSFLATPNVDDSAGLGLFSATSGVWAVRADLFDGGSKGFFAHVYRPIPVVQVGDLFPIDGSAIVEVSVYDQAANEVYADDGSTRNQSLGDHRVALWISTSSNDQAILRGTYTQQLGGSGANSTHGCGATGTLGSLVSMGGASYVLSNDHVFGDPLSATQNGASIGDTISSPGAADYDSFPAPGVATFSSAPVLNEEIDAALAVVDTGALNATGQIYNVGVPSATPAAPSTVYVAKQGRTTAFTCAPITMFGATVKEPVNYQLCSGKKFSHVFKNLIMIQTSDVPFSLPGDSGSLIVTQSTAQPVGLLFADTQVAPYNTFAFPAKTVAGKLGVTFVGGSSHSVDACTAGAAQPVALSDSETARVSRVKERYEDTLLTSPSVMGVGIGRSEENLAEGAIIVMVQIGSTPSIPAYIEGVRTHIVYSGPIEAF